MRTFVIIAIGVVIIAIIIAAIVIPPSPPREISYVGRPFSVSPIDGLQQMLGIFDSELGTSLIGLYVLNKDVVPHTNVKVTFVPPATSNIVMISDIVTIDRLLPNMPTLIFFKGDFSNVAPNKYDVDLIFQSDQTSIEHESARIFTSKSYANTSDPNFGGNDTISTEFPEGKMTVYIEEFYGGTNWRSQWATTVESMILEYKDPFMGQSGPVPFSDWIWKACGLVGKGLLAFTSGYKLAEGIDKGEKIQAAAAAGTALVTISEAATFSDDADPFIRGQQNTNPNLGERTTKEIVRLKADYLDEPMTGTPFRANTNWNYTRVTVDNLSQEHRYFYSISNEMVSNQHWAKNFTLNTDASSYVRGDKVTIVATIKGKNGALLTMDDTYVVVMIHETAQFPQFGEYVVLTDDGRGTDISAGDGKYSGSTILNNSWPTGNWSLTLFAQENLFGFNEFGSMVLNDFPVGSSDSVKHVTITVG